MSGFSDAIDEIAGTGLVDSEWTWGTYRAKALFCCKCGNRLKPKEARKRADYVQLDKTPGFPPGPWCGSC